MYFNDQKGGFFYLRQQHFFSSKYLRSATSPCLPMLKEEIGRW